MDTEPGGESTQYESIATVNKPHAKEAGQLGDPAQQTRDMATEQTPDNTHGGSGTSSAVRAGGKTGSSSGGARELEEEEGEAAKTRRKQGYGGEADMRRDVGA